MKFSKVIAIFITVLIEIGLIIGLIAFLYKYTSGFKESFKTFTVEYAGNILTVEDNLTLEPDNTHRFKVDYLFDFGKEDREYLIKIIPNQSAEIDFEYRLDNQMHSYSELQDLTLGFRLTQTHSYFEIYLPADWSMKDMMTKLLKTKGNPVIPEVDIADELYPFTLVVASYDQKTVYKVNFNVQYSAEQF